MPVMGTEFRWSGVAGTNAEEYSTCSMILAAFIDKKRATRFTAAGTRGRSRSRMPSGRMSPRRTTAQLMASTTGTPADCGHVVATINYGSRHWLYFSSTGYRVPARAAVAMPNLRRRVTDAISPSDCRVTTDEKSPKIISDAESRTKILNSFARPAS